MSKIPSMRKREEIEVEAHHNDVNAGPRYSHARAILEVLLDIRDLLSKLK